MLQLAEAGLPVTRSGLENETVRICTFVPRKGAEEWLRKGKLGKKWFKGFLMRHNYLSLRKAEKLGRSRAEVKREKIEEFYKILEGFDNTYNFKARHVYNMDETYVDTDSDIVRVIAK